MHFSPKARKSLRSRLRRRAQFLAILLGTIPAASDLMAQSYWSATTPTTYSTATGHDTSASWGNTSNWALDALGATGGAIPDAVSVGAVFNITANNTVGSLVTLNANRAAQSIVVNTTGLIAISANSASGSTGTTRNLIIGSGGITVNSGSLTLGITTTAGLINTALLESQTWTNNSSAAISWQGRLVGHESTTLTKAGTGSLRILGSGTAANLTNLNGATVTGLRGRVIINSGLLATVSADALGQRDAQTVLTASSGLSLVSDTVVNSGGTLDTNNSTIGAEFITFQGTGGLAAPGVNAGGAIVNRGTGTGNTNNVFTQVKMSGDATVGGTARFDFRAANPNAGRFFQDGFTLTKSGGNTIGIVNTQVIGGGSIEIRQGTLEIGGSTSLENASGTTTSAGAGTITIQGGNLQFNGLGVLGGGSITRPIVMQGNTIAQNDSINTTTIGSSITATTALVTFNVTDNNDSSPVGTLITTGTFTSDQTIVKTGSGIFRPTLDGATYTGSLINVRGGTFDLNTGTPIAASITLNIGSTGGAIQRPGIAGEGQTAGILTFGSGTGLTSNILYFDGSTTGAGQHLRVGGVVNDGSVASSVEVKSRNPIPDGNGIVVLDNTAATGIGLGSAYFFNGRGTLDTTTDPNKILLDYAAGNLAWRGSDVTNPTFWDTKTSTSWFNSGSAANDVFFEADKVLFDDTVTGVTTVVPVGPVSPQSISFNNNSVNYTIGGSTAGSIQMPNGTLTKSGTGTATITTTVGSPVSFIGSTTVNQGVLELAWAPGNTSSATPVVTNLGQGSSVTINSGGTLRSIAGIANSGFGANPVAVNTGGILDFLRGAVPNGTNTTPAAVTVSNAFSGAGDIILRSTNDGITIGPTVVLSTTAPAYGNYTISGISPSFSGRFVLDNSRLLTTNASAGSAVANLGTATVVAPVNSQILLNAAQTWDNNIFQIAGTGWIYEPSSNGGPQSFGSLRLNTNAIVGASSTIQLTGDARISAQNSSGTINGDITGTHALQIGNPLFDATGQNGTLIIGGVPKSFTGPVSIANHAINVNANGAFGSGPVAIAGVTNARVTYIAVGNAVSVNNPISISTGSGQGGNRGAIEGGTTAQVTALGAGVGTVNGTVTIAGGLVNTWAHFSAGQGAGSALHVNGPVNAPTTTLVLARSSNAGGYVQFAGGGSYARFDLGQGTVRLGANDGLASGTELQTRRVADSAITGGGTARGIFDMNGYNQTVNFVSRAGTLTTANFALVNTNSSGNSPVSLLTINGGGASNIQNIPNIGAGTVNISKSGTGSLVLGAGPLGTPDASFVDLTGTGTYTVNDGAVAVQGTSGASTNVGGTFVMNNASTLDAGNSVYSGNVTLNNTSAMSSNGAQFSGVITANAGTGVTGNVTLTNNAVLTGSTTVAANVTTTGNATIGGNLNLAGAVTLNPAGGTKFSPGNSPGTQTFGTSVAVSGTGNSFEWELLTPGTGVPGPIPPALPLGTPGTDYDVIAFNGGLDLTGLNTGGFQIDVVGLLNPTTVGAVAGFNPLDSYSWMLFDNLSVTNFDPANFVVNPATFNASNPNAGTWSVAQVGNDIVLNYSGVPEPSSIMLLVTGMGITTLVRRRRKDETQS